MRTTPFGNTCSRKRRKNSSSAIAPPGHENLGHGRHCHFLADFAWPLTGLTYLVMLFVTPEWRRLIPTSWQIVPDAWHAMLSCLSFHVVEPPGGYNALQQLSYVAVIFLLAPFSIARGVAMPPAVAARFPWYIKIFHGRQGARSLHFLALCSFIVFFIGHVTIVAVHGFQRELALIVLEQTHDPQVTLALVVWLSGLTAIAVILTVTTVCSRRRPRSVQKATQSIIDPLRTLLFGHEISAQHYHGRAYEDPVNYGDQSPGSPDCPDLASPDFDKVCVSEQFCSSTVVTLAASVRSCRKWQEQPLG